MKRAYALRVVAVIVKSAIDRADRITGAAYMFALMHGFAYATAGSLRFYRAWWAIFDRELRVNLIVAGLAEPGE